MEAMEGFEGGKSKDSTRAMDGGGDIIFSQTCGCHGGVAIIPYDCSRDFWWDTRVTAILPPPQKRQSNSGATTRGMGE